MGPTVADELRRDVRFALTFKVGKSRRPLTDSVARTPLIGSVGRMRAISLKKRGCCPMPGKGTA